MIRLKLFMFCLLCLLGTRSLNAQQIQQFTQYQFAGISFNPAFTGTDSYFNALAIHRTQWAGVNDAPRTYFMSLDAPSKSKKMGFGGMLYTDVAGPTKRFGVQGAYSYQLQITEDSKLSLGLSFGMTQFTIDGTQITLREPGDQALTGQVQSELNPDASFGALWYADNYYVGVSAMQILNNKLDLFPGDGDGQMVPHYYFTGGYKFQVSEDFEVEPTALLKYVNPLPVQLDASARIIYKSNLWLGGSYRTDDAASVFAGYRIKEYLAIGYSFDFTTSNMKKYSDGTHEIFIQFRFGKAQMLDDKEDN